LQGYGTARYPVRTCAQERCGADSYCHRHRRGAADRRRRGDGECVRHTGTGAADHRCHRPPRLSRHPRHRAAVQLRLCAGQPGGRRGLHPARSEDPLLSAQSSIASMPPPEVAVAPVMPDVLPPIKVRRGLSGFVYRHPSIAFGGALLIVMLLIAVLAPYLGTVDPTALAPAKRTRSPSADFWFGTDMLGRDIYSRVLYGARVSLMVGFSVALLASLAGLIIGLVSGFV